MAEIGLTDPQDDRVMNREKVKLALYTMYNYSFMDSANLCQFVYGPSWQLIGPAEMAELATAVTGWPLSVADIQQIGERRLNLTRAFNAREGAGRERDTLPKRLFDVPLQGGVSDGLSIPARSWSRRWTITTKWPVGTPTACPRRSSWKRLGWGGCCRFTTETRRHGERLGSPCTPSHVGGFARASVVPLRPSAPPPPCTLLPHLDRHGIIAHAVGKWVLPARTPGHRRQTDDGASEH